MKFTNNHRLLIFIAVALVVAIGAIVFTLAVNAAPLGVLSHYGSGFLLEQARTMNECAECHEAADYHACNSCHDDHGAIEFEDGPFYNVVTLTGDVPEPGFIRLNDIFPYRDYPNTHLSLLDFLAEQGVMDFESVTLVANDGGFVTIEPVNLSEQALLLPYADGIRFAADDLHVSTWMKGITRFIVVGKATPLTINGEATSIGRLLLGPTYSVTVQQTDVMLTSKDDGRVREAKTATRLDGVRIADIIGAFETLTITDESGSTVTLSAEDAHNAMLAAERYGVTLILPDRGRSQWIEQVVEIQSQ